MREFEQFTRIGVEKPRSYYIPFAQKDKIAFEYKIISRKSSSRFISLDGIWKIKEHQNVDGVVIDEKLTLRSRRNFAVTRTDAGKTGGITSNFTGRIEEHSGNR